MGKHFVLLHGAWHGGWCWEGVVEEPVLTGWIEDALTYHNENLQE